MTPSPFSTMTPKRTYKEVKRQLKPMQVDYREYDFGETITGIFWAEKSSYDDYIHFLYQTIRTEMALTGEDVNWLLTKNPNSTPPTDYEALSQGYLHKCIQERNTSAQNHASHTKTLQPLPALLTDYQFIDGYIIKPLDEMGDFDLIMTLNQYYVRFFCQNLA